MSQTVKWESPIYKTPDEHCETLIDCFGRVKLAYYNHDSNCWYEDIAYENRQALQFWMYKPKSFNEENNL